MKKTAMLLLAGLLLMTGCAAGGESGATEKEESTVRAGYRQIDRETAAQMMEEDDGHIVVDVRRLDEYESGHIPGAVCIPNESIGGEKPEELPNPEQTILVYCRSGNRSRQAAEKLAALGYTDVCEFGGIIDWTGDVTQGQTLALTLKSNPTTGYSWNAEQDPALFEIRSFYTAEPRSAPVSGAGGWQTFLFTPKEPGTAELRFRYERPWEKDGGDTECVFTVEIGGDLTLSVTEDGSGQAGDFAPRLKIY